MFNTKLITYKFFTKTTSTYKCQLQNNRFTEQKYFLKEDYKTKVVEILR